MSLITVIQQAADEVGMNRPPTNIVSATDPQSLQWLQLLRRQGWRMMAKNEWSALIKEYTFPTVASQPSYPMPADFDRPVNDTQWNTANRVPLFGPQSQQDWAQNEFGMINVGPFYRQQLRGSQLWLQPTPASVNTIGLYYISTQWILQGGTTPSTQFLGDTDGFVYDELLLTAGLVWRWKRAKGLDYGEEIDAYRKMEASALAGDRGARTLSLDPAKEQNKPRYGFVVPITGFGQ